MGSDGTDPCLRRRGYPRACPYHWPIMSRQPAEKPTPGRKGGTPGSTPPQEQNWRWAIFVLVGLVALAVLVPSFAGKPDRKQLSYGELVSKAQEGAVTSATINNDTGRITGTYREGGKTLKYSVGGPHPVPDNVEQLLRDKIPPDKLNFDNDTPNLLMSFLPFGLMVLLFLGVWVFMSRRAQGQMSGMMSIGRSKAKVYTTEKPEDGVLRRGRLRGREAGDQGGRRLPQVAGQVPGDRRPHPQGRAARRPAGHRQDAARAGGGR